MMSGASVANFLEGGEEGTGVRRLKVAAARRDCERAKRAEPRSTWVRSAAEVDRRLAMTEAG
jgi:hypothetical protein